MWVHYGERWVTMHGHYKVMDHRYNNMRDETADQVMCKQDANTMRTHLQVGDLGELGVSGQVEVLLSEEHSL